MSGRGEEKKKRMQANDVTKYHLPFLHHASIGIVARPTIDAERGGIYSFGH